MKILGLMFVIVLLGFPLLGSRFLPTHDGEYHIIRFMEFYTMLSSGYLFPRWAPTLNSGFGIPIFLFHYPFPNYIGSLFHALGFQFVDAFKLALFSGYLLAGVCSYIFLSKLWDKRSAFFGTIAALTVPYWFVDIYVRGSVGEVWAIAWMFAALASVAWKRSIFLSLSVGLLILSHNIQALLFLPIITTYTFFRYRQGLWAIFLGLLLSSYFWIPALAERSYVVGLSTVNPLDHFASVWELLIPSWGTEFSGRSIAANKMSFQIGLMPLLWLILAGWRYMILAAIVVILMLPISQSIWSIVPFLNYVQYPWRLLSLMIPLVAISAAYAATKISVKSSMALTILAVLFVYGYSRPAMYERRDDAYYQTRSNFTDGTSSMGNSFSTIWTPWKSQRPEHAVEILEGNGTLTLHETKPLLTKFTVVAHDSVRVRINTLYFPGWGVYDQEKPLSIDFETDGLINIALAPGTHDLAVRFEETPVRKAANMASLIGLLWVSGWAILEFVYANRNKHVSDDKRPQRAGHRPLHKRASKRAI